VLKVCLNGGRAPEEHPAVPVTPEAVAADAARCAALGAGAAHVHPRDGAGRETLDAGAVAATLNALRAAAPALPIGVSTGAWIEPRAAARIAAIRSWTVLPDFASVNAHESGAEEVARALQGRGIGVEAGVWTVDAVRRYRTWRIPAVRVLIECLAPDVATALADAARMLAELPATGPPVLLHAEGPAVWPVLREAVRRRLDTRVGLEDTLALPDGSPAAGNAALAAAAVALGAT
jgi:uncharacterized protein (DUF849 family)